MKKIYILYSLSFLLCIPAGAQTEVPRAELLADAGGFFKEDQFNAAIPLYRELADRGDADAGVLFTLAECYRKTFNYPEAEAYYLKTIYNEEHARPLASYYYALMLKFNGHFEESISQFDRFIDEHQHDLQLREYIEQAVVDREGCVMARSQQAGSTKNSNCEAMPAGINTRYNDFAPAARDSMTLAITSSRVLSNRVVIDERFGEAFCDNYYFQKSGADWHEKTRTHFAALNSRYNDGSGCFNSTGDRYYYTVCGKDGAQCKIFCSAWKKNNWTEPVALNDNINFKNYESKQPALSHGGDTLLFVSNRPGGMGHYDLWMSINDGDDRWGPAMNLGGGINTKLNEMSPSFTSLPFVFFFASDGHEGYGGLDLYMAKKLSSGETVVYNLNAPYNSNRDDCFINIHGKTIYFSSNREDGMGGFDIYSSRVPSPIAFVSRISLNNRDARRNIKLKSRADTHQNLSLIASRNEEKIDYDNLTYEKRKVVDTMVAGRMQRNTPEKSNFTNLSQEEFDALDRLAKERYDVLVGQQKFKGAIVTHFEVASETPDDYFVTGSLTDSTTGAKQPSVTLYLTDEFGEALKTTRTNGDGTFRFTDVPSGKKLYILSENSFHDGVNHYVIKDLVMLQSPDQNIIYGENIYFDFDHYVIRPEARKVLDDLARYLQQNSNVQVEIFAFADDRGSQEYNLNLTQKRGQSVVDYLTAHGVDATALAIVSRGKLISPEGNDELQRQLSRRVEFYLNGVKADLQDETKTFILKSESTWTNLSKLMHVEKEVLKKLNNSTAEDLKAFQPIRVPSMATASVSGELFFAIN